MKGECGKVMNMSIPIIGALKAAPNIAEKNVANCLIVTLFNYSIRTIKIQPTKKLRLFCITMVTKKVISNKPSYTTINYNAHTDRINTNQQLSSKLL